MNTVNVTVEQRKCVVATLEIKTRVWDSTLSTAEKFHREEPYIENIQCQKIKEVVPIEHMLQMIYQCVVLNVKLCLYVFVSESGIIYSAILFVDRTVLSPDLTTV